ncbi:hypothetical protein ACFW2K_35650 [Streptomyces nigra]|uniref:hypothetical protein n=1 Tax=Streptomyces nigra TaxID=1827580 RepID=UPI0036A9BDB4
MLLEQGVELVVIKELLGHAHIGVTATVYAHVKLRLQRDAIYTLSTALGSPEDTKTARSDGDEPPPSSADVAVNYCRHHEPKPRQDAPDGTSGLQTYTRRRPKFQQGEISENTGHSAHFHQ